MSAGEDRPRDGAARRDVWLAGPDDVVYEIDEEAVARLRAVMATPRWPRPRRRGYAAQRHERAPTTASRA